jgi:hypothetical protein
MLGPDGGANPPILRAMNEQQDLQEKLKKEHEDMVRAQIAKYHEYMQNKMPSNRSDQGVLEKVAYQTGMSAEGQVGEILTIMIMSALMSLFGTHYWIQGALWKDAQRRGLAYEPGADGKYPKIYAQYQSDGTPVGEPLSKENITRDLIRQAGYVPKPSYTESWKNSWDTYQAWMVGPNTLTDEQKRRTLMVAGDAYNKLERSDTQKRYDAMMANQRPVPKAR